VDMVPEGAKSLADVTKESPELDATVEVVESAKEALPISGAIIDIAEDVDGQDVGSNVLNVTSAVTSQTV
jgi:hypothetical protein